MGNTGSAHHFDVGGATLHQQRNCYNSNDIAWHQQRQDAGSQRWSAAQQLQTPMGKVTATGRSSAAETAEIQQQTQYYSANRSRLRKRQQNVGSGNGVNDADSSLWMTNSLPHMGSGGDKQTVQRAQLKVLPPLKTNERPKLRATTNGGILNAGGTLSGRRERPPAYTRSATMLVMPTALSAAPKLEPSATAAPTTKFQKYQKKRRAPPTPATNVLPPTTTAKTKAVAAIKANVRNTASKDLEQIDNSKKNHLAAVANVGVVPIADRPLPYRRERSSSAILLRPTAVGQPQQRLQNDSNRIVKNMALAERQPTIAMESRQVVRQIRTLPQPQVSKTQIIAKDPPLKNNFYFGMNPRANNTNNNNNSSNDFLSAPPQKETEPQQRMATRHLDDNGLMVLMQPTLPRRRLQDSPSFSPTGAWRSIDAQQANAKAVATEVCQQLKSEAEQPIKRHSIKSNRNSRIPIQKASTPAATWTPEQDLDNDDEDDILVAGGQMEANIFGNGRSINDDNKPCDKINGQQSSTKINQQSQNNNRNKSILLYPWHGYNSLQQLKHYHVPSSDSDDDIDNVDGAMAEKAAINDNWLLYRTYRSNVGERCSSAGSKGTAGDIAIAAPVERASTLTYLSAGKRNIYLPHC